MSGTRKKNGPGGANGVSSSSTSSSCRSSTSGRSTSGSSGGRRGSESKCTANSVVWQWQDDGDKDVYHDFEADISQRLESAYTDRKKADPIKVPSFGRRPKCLVKIRDGMSMTEASKKKLPSRRVWLVQRLINGDRSDWRAGSIGGQPCWQWQYDLYGEQDAWGQYSPECAAVLEAAWLSDQAAVHLYEIDSLLPYVVDVKAKSQTNVCSSYSRAVRRLMLQPLQQHQLMLPQTQQQRHLAQQPLGRLVSSHITVTRTPLPAQPLSVSSAYHGHSTMSSQSGRIDDSSSSASSGNVSTRFYGITQNADAEVPTSHSCATDASGLVDQFVESAQVYDSREVCPICLEELDESSSSVGAVSVLSNPVVSKSVTSSKDDGSPHKSNSTRSPWRTSNTSFVGFSSTSDDPGAASGTDHGSLAAAEESWSSSVVRLKLCKHQLHRLCLSALMNQSAGAKQGAAGSFKCPTCGQRYGVVTGTCPSGRMTDQRLSDCHLRGFDDCGVICITYDIASGRQGPEHPHPGRPFHAAGFPRMAYLPDNGKGSLVLQMLKVAFDRRLTFTVGTSVTTGHADVVTWNEIHHKTSLEGPYGYPDAGYLDRVISELEAFGIMANDYSD